MTNPITKAALIVGSRKALGRVCGVSQQAVTKWEQMGRLPRTAFTGEKPYAQAIAAATGGQVSVAELLHGYRAS